MQEFFSPSNSISGVKNCGKSFICCQYINGGIENTFKTVDKKFEIRIPFNCESKNLIYAVICSGCREKYIGQTQTMFKERLNIYRQHKTYFIEKCKPTLNKRHRQRTKNVASTAFTGKISLTRMVRNLAKSKSSYFCLVLVVGFELVFTLYWIGHTVS